MSWDCLQDWLDVALEPVVLLIIAVTGYFWGLKSWRKQKQEEGKYLIEQKKYEAKIEACKAAWSLIIYFSENDSDQNMLRRGETDEQGDKTYYFKQAQAKLFFDALQRVFFTEGHGLFLSKEIKSLLFEMRSQMYGLYHHALKCGDPEIRIQKKELVNRVVKIREELIERLHKYIEEDSLENKN